MFSMMLVVLPIVAAYGQESSFQLSVGYGIGIGTKKLGEDIYTSGGQTTRTGVFGSQGGGINASASFRRMFNPHVGLDIAVGYLFGSSIETAERTSSSTSSLSDRYVSYANSLSLEPTLVLAAEMGNLKPYARIGPSIAFVNMRQENDVVVNNTGVQQTSNNVIEFTGGPTLGVRGGAGLMFSATSSIRFFTEVMFTSMTFYPQKGEVVLYTVNLGDRLSTLSTAERYANFVTEISSSSPSSSNEPATVMQFDVPMSNLQLNVGVYFKLGKNAEGK